MQELGPDWDSEAIEAACAELRSALDDAQGVSQQAVERIEETVLPPLATATVERDDGATLDSGAVEDLDRFGGTLQR